MSTVTPATADTTPTNTVAASDNPLLRPWTGPHGGVPPFDQVEVAHFEPAIEAAMAENLAEVERIANSTKILSGRGGELCGKIIVVG